MGRGWLLKWNGPRYLCQVIEIKLFQGIPSFNGISDDNRYLVEEKAFRYFTLTSVSNSLYSFKVLTSTAIFFSQSVLNLVGIVNETFLVINTSPIPIGKSLKIADKKNTEYLVLWVSLELPNNKNIKMISPVWIDLIFFNHSEFSSSQLKLH